MNQPDIKQLCEELKPVCNNANQLYMHYLLSDDFKEKEEIAQQIQLLHFKAINQNQLNDKKVILPPPAPEEAKGEFPIGKVVYNNQALYEFGLNCNELQQHTLIMGRSGAGKSTLLKAFIGGFLIKGLPFMAFDHKKEFRSIFSILPKENLRWYSIGSTVSPLDFNLLKKPTGIELDEWIQTLADLICQIFFISYGGRSKLREGLQYVFNKYENPKLVHLKEWLDEQTLRGRSGLWLESTGRAIDCLAFGSTGKAFNSDNELDINELIIKNVIFELDNVGAEIQDFFTSYLMLRISLNAKNKNNHKLRHVLIFDEGHRIFKKQNKIDIGERITETMCRELRSFGHGLIISTQNPSMLSTEAFGNSYTKICFNLNIDEEIDTACGSLLLHGNKKDFVNRLQVGYAIVKLSDRISEPFQIQTMDFSNKHDPAPDSMIQDFMQAFGLIHCHNPIDSIDSGINNAPQFKPKTPELIPETAKNNAPLVTPIELDRQQLSFIKELVKNPFLNTTAIYKKLNLCTAVGNKIKYGLISKCILKPVKIEQKHGQTVLLEITPKAREILKKKYDISIQINTRRGSLEHQYWQEKIAGSYRQKGYNVTIEYPAGNGKTIDIVVINKNGEKIGFGIETGKSDIVQNIKTALDSGISKYYLVPTNRDAEIKIANISRRNSNDHIYVKKCKDFFR